MFIISSHSSNINSNSTYGAASDDQKLFFMVRSRAAALHPFVLSILQQAACVSVTVHACSMQQKMHAVMHRGHH